MAEATPPASKRPAVVAALAASLLLVGATGASVRFLSERAPGGDADRDISSAVTVVSTSPTTTHDEPTVGITLAAQLGSTERRSQAVVVNGDTLVTTMAAVAKASSLAAVLPNGQRFAATLLGTDGDSGIAVVNVSDARLDADAMGSAVALQTGDQVWMAGYDHPGTITAMGRHTTTADGTRLNHIMRLQIDQGRAKEGQPLIDATGKVVGLCTRDAKGDVIGIPIDLATSAATSLRTFQRLKLPWLGITGRDALADPDDGVPDGGALLTGVTPGGPAALAGLQAGDVVVGLGPAKVTSISALVLAARAYKVGDTVPVTLRRSHQSLTVHLTLGELP